jgi:hypothetical protein
MFLLQFHGTSLLPNVSQAFKIVLSEKDRSLSPAENFTKNA